MMLEGKKNIEDGFRKDVEYYNIPDQSSNSTREVEHNQVMVYEETSYVSILIAAILVLGWIVHTLKHSTYELWNVLLGIVLVLSLVYLIVRKCSNRLFLIISREGINFKGDLIRWEEISNMYLKKQDTGEDYSFDIVIKRIESKQLSISIDYLSSQPKDIWLSVGKFYWLWYSESVKE